GYTPGEETDAGGTDKPRRVDGPNCAGAPGRRGRRTVTRAPGGRRDTSGGSRGTEVREWTRKHSLGGVRFRSEISGHEASVLRSLVSSVVGMLDAREEETPQDDLAALTGMRSGDSEPPSDPIPARLLPDFHRPEKESDADPAEAADLNGALRSLHELDIIAEKRRVAREMLASVPEGGGRIVLTPEQAHSWATALNDIRLAL